MSRQACQLICVLSQAMGSQFDSLAVQIMPALFKVLVITVQVQCPLSIMPITVCPYEIPHWSVYWGTLNICLIAQCIRDSSQDSVAQSELKELYQADECESVIGDGGCRTRVHQGDRDQLALMAHCAAHQRCYLQGPEPQAPAVLRRVPCTGPSRVQNSAGVCNCMPLLNAA